MSFAEAIVASAGTVLVLGFGVVVVFEAVGMALDWIISRERRARDRRAARARGER